jgi:pimeloyl-ACP methyl ester carboxylesterase
MGHSFGGYVCGNYALKFHQHIKKLILISPIGIRVKEPNEAEFGRVLLKMKEAMGQGIKPPPLWAKMMLKFAWARKITPF